MADTEVEILAVNQARQDISEALDPKSLSKSEKKVLKDSTIVFLGVIAVIRPNSKQIGVVRVIGGVTPEANQNDKEIRDAGAKQVAKGLRKAIIQLMDEQQQELGIEAMMQGQKPPEDYDNGMSEPDYVPN